MKREFYVERRRVILRTAKGIDAADYVCQRYPNNRQEKQREEERNKLETQLKNVDDGLSVVTVLRQGDKKFIGFIFAKPLNDEHIVFLDLIIPCDSNKRLYALDCIKQFVKTLKEEKLCKSITFEDYTSSENKEYIEEFLKEYKSRNIQVY